MTATVLSAKSLAERQGVPADLLAAGARQALNSCHLSGHAMDPVPRINGKLRREWTPIHHIADAVRQAANEPGKPII